MNSNMNRVWDIRFVLDDRRTRTFPVTGTVQKAVSSPGPHAQRTFVPRSIHRWPPPLRVEIERHPEVDAVVVSASDSRLTLGKEFADDSKRRLESWIISLDPPNRLGEYLSEVVVSARADEVVFPSRVDSDLWTDRGRNVVWSPESLVFIAPDDADTVTIRSVDQTPLELVSVKCSSELISTRPSEASSMENFQLQVAWDSTDPAQDAVVVETVEIQVLPASCRDPCGNHRPSDLVSLLDSTRSDRQTGWSFIMLRFDVHRAFDCRRLRCGNAVTSGARGDDRRHYCLLDRKAAALRVRHD